jgi:glycosyltransferase involved in cell wall biosynthesis
MNIEKIQEDSLEIIIPLYNLGHHLKECLTSVYNSESSLQFTVTIVDDCSTDDSLAVARKLAMELIDHPGHRLTSVYSNPKNVHLSATRNIALARTSSTLIICLDADDMIPPNYIEDNYKNILEHDVDISYTNSQCFGTSSQLLTWPEFSIDLIRESPFINCSAMYKRNVWDKAGPYDETMKLGWEDYDFWLSAAKRGFKFRKCNTTYLAYRQSESSMINTTNEQANQFKIREHLREKHPAFYRG